MSPDRNISNRTRKRLWTHAADRCAFPGCDKELLRPTPDGQDETIVGVECHIVAQRDHPSVARAPCLLTEDERRTYAQLIEHRHAFDNLVVMCAVHSTIIDDPGQGHTVADVVAMKAGHQAKIARQRRAARAARAPTAGGLGDGDATQTPLILTDLPTWASKAIRQLAEAEPQTWSWLASEIGDPPDPSLAVALINDWPESVAKGSAELQQALARVAEGAGEWRAAATAWEHLADAAEEPACVDHMVRAAIDAGVGGDTDRRARLLDAASLIDEDCPRLVVERMEDMHLSPAEQLDYLAGLATDDVELGALIAAHRTRAALLLPDLVQAERHLREAASLAPDALNVRGMSVNVRVQRARLAVINDEPSSLEEARAAREDALALRETLLEMRRFDESVRLLMLAADVAAVQRDGEAASEILAQATAEELASKDGVAVLGDAALRAGDPALARRFAGTAPEGDDAALRIDATARIDLNEHRAVALRELRDLALASGPEARHAAFARLSACMPPVAAPWDEDVAQVLDVDGPEQPRRTLVQLRILTLARTGNLSDAEQRLHDLPDEPWAAELALRVAGIRGKAGPLQEAAERFLGFGPDASGQLLAARGFAKAGNLSRAAQTLATVTNDPNAPARVRADGFATLMRVLADSEDWARAARVWEAWRRFTEGQGVTDDQLSAWQVRVAHHRKTVSSPR